MKPSLIALLAVGMALGSLTGWLLFNGQKDVLQAEGMKNIIHSEGKYVLARSVPCHIKPIINAVLIDCLIFYESSGNPEAVGDEGRAYGLLQFHRPTFDRYAKKYNMSLDYHNPDDQILLADMMLEDNFENIRHWSVYPKCIKGR